jgi:hypothetical protein
MMWHAQGMSAFLERTNWTKACGGQNWLLQPGALLEVVVTAAPKQGKCMVHVSVDPKAKAKAVVKVGCPAAHLTLKQTWKHACTLHASVECWIAPPQYLREVKTRDNAAGFVDRLQTENTQHVLAWRILTQCCAVKTCDMQEWEGLITGSLLLEMLVNAKVHSMLSDRSLDVWRANGMLFRKGV